MALWGSVDDANNSPIYTPSQFNLAPNTDNRDALFTNSTADAFVTNETVGVFGVNDNEMAASLGKFPHTGWVIKHTGSGGRAGRVWYECLVAGGFSVDANVAGTPNNTIVVSIHPTSKSVNDNLSTTFSVNAVTAPSGGTITYLWQANTGSGFANLSNAGVYSNVGTATLSISNVHSLNAVSYRCFLRSTGAANVNTNGATLTVV
jgi:hypothetical protein